MQKAILIIDMPGGCNDCPVAEIYKVGLERGLFCSLVKRSALVKNINKRFPDCPLKPLPEKKVVTANDATAAVAIKYGWNNCLDEILREEDHGEV